MAEFGAVFVRVKLDLRCAVPHQGTRDLVWIVADISKTATIGQFALLVRSKYGLPKEIELYLDDALLPHGEPTVILKDGDTVRVVRPIKQRSLNSGSQSANHPEPLQAADVEDAPGSSDGAEVDSVIALDDDDTSSQVAYLPIEQEVGDPPESSDGVEVDSVLAVDADDTLDATWPDHSPESTIDEGSTPCFLAARSTPALIDEPTSSTSQNSSPPSTPGRVIAMPDSVQCHDKRQHRSIGVIKQQLSSDSQGDNSPEPLPATDQHIKDAVWVPSESSDSAKFDNEPAVEVGVIVDKAWQDHSYTSKLTTDRSATPCFPAPQSTMNSGPPSSILVHPKTMGTSVATPNSLIRGMRCRGKKWCRRRRPTNKAYVDKCTQTLESPIFRPLALVRSPVQLGRQHCLDGNMPGDLQHNAQSAPARKLPYIVYVAKSTKRAREQESLQAGRNGQDQQVPAKASRCNSAPRPPDIPMPEAES